jgi:hypothetical protein
MALPAATYVTDACAAGRPAERVFQRVWRASLLA